MLHSDHSLLLNIQRIPPDSQVILVDVDGVLFDNTPRLHHIAEVVDGRIQYKTDADWVAYEKQAHQDAPMELCKLLRKFASMFHLVFLSARSDDEYQINTFVRALQPFLSTNNGNWYYQFKGSLPHEEHPVEFKRRIIRLLRDNNVDIVLAIDDSLKNIEMFKQEGVCALRCHDTINKTNMHY